MPTLRTPNSGLAGARCVAVTPTRVNPWRRRLRASAGVSFRGESRASRRTKRIPAPKPFNAAAARRLCLRTFASRARELCEEVEIRERVSCFRQRSGVGCSVCGNGVIEVIAIDDSGTTGTSRAARAAACPRLTGWAVACETHGCDTDGKRFWAAFEGPARCRSRGSLRARCSRTSAPAKRGRRSERERIGRRREEG